MSCGGSCALKLRSNMEENGVKRILIILLALFCAVTTTGCVPLSVNMQRADQAVELPLPEETPSEPVVGDDAPSVSQYVELYLVSDDGQQLTPVSRVVTVGAGQSPATETLLALLRVEDTADAHSPFPDGTRLLGVERSGNVAVVDLSIEARSVESDQQALWMRQSVAATLIGLDGIEYVNLLVAGQSESPSAMPAGAAQRTEEDLAGAWAHLTADQELFSRSDGDAPALERTAVLYYASRDGQYVCPVARTVRVSEADCITPVIEALMLPPGETDSLRSPLPSDAAVLTEKPEIVETEDGRRMVELSFDANLVAMLEREGLTAWQLYASLTYTLTGFLPEIDGLIVRLGDGQLTRTERNGQELPFSGGEMTRADYPDAVCRLATVYLSSSDGGLLRLCRPMQQENALSPRALLGELFAGPAVWEENAARVLPDGVSVDDVLGVRIFDGQATVNLSSNFYKCCQCLTAQQERALIYAMVNTLTELSGVSAVRFQVEGETVDSLVGSIYLRGALMRNPGMIR